MLSYNELSPNAAPYVSFNFAQRIDKKCKFIHLKVLFLYIKQINARMLLYSTNKHLLKVKTTLKVFAIVTCKFCTYYIDLVHKF